MITELYLKKMSAATANATATATAANTSIFETRPIV